MVGWRILFALLAALAFASPARAANVSAYVDEIDGQVAEVWDPRSERNDLLVNYDFRRGRLQVTERGSRPLRAREGCRQQSTRRVICRAAEATVDIDAGGGRDTITCRGSIFWIAGGQGDDVVRSRCSASYIQGGPGRDVLIGGEHPDRLIGGSGRDKLIGGLGNDSMFGDGNKFFDAFDGGEPADFYLRSQYRSGQRADFFDGGPGVDTVSWTEHPQGVRVDMATGTGPEGDRLTAVENIVGGTGKDVLLGDHRRNQIFGASGEDYMSGRGGSDTLDGGEAPFFGDEPTYPDERSDRFACGAGSDLVRFDELSPLPISCERRSAHAARPPVPIHLRPAGRRKVSVPATCQIVRYRCRVRATLTRGRTRLGRSRITSVSSGVKWLLVRLNRPLPTHTPLRVTLTGTQPQRVEGSVPYEFSESWRIRCLGPPACRGKR